MTLYTDGLRQREQIGIDEIWAADLSHYLGQAAIVGKVLASVVVIAMAIWLLARLMSPQGAALLGLPRLWLKAKEQSLLKRAGRKPTPG